MTEYKFLEEKKDIPAQKRTMEEIEKYTYEDDPEIAMLEKILAEKKAKLKYGQNEM